MIYFVYRSHYEGPWSKRVVVLEEEDTIYDWFVHAMHSVKGMNKQQVGAWLNARQLDDVYALAGVFEEMAHGEVEFSNIEELIPIFDENAYGQFFANDGLFWCHTDDDELELAYYFIEVEQVMENPDRLNYLINDIWPLRETFDPNGGFSPEPSLSFQPLALEGEGEGAVFVCMLTFEDGDSLAVPTPRRIDGIRLPELAEALRAATPPVNEPRYGYHDSSWDTPLLLMRAMVDDDDWLAALERINKLPSALRGEYDTVRWCGAPMEARNALYKAQKDGDHRRDGDPEKSVFHVSPHCIQASFHLSNWAGHQQWFIFDDCWASANAELAQGLLYYCNTPEIF